MNTDSYICILVTLRKQVCPHFTRAINSFVFCYSRLYKHLFEKQINGYLTLNKEGNSYFALAGKSHSDF